LANLVQGTGVLHDWHVRFIVLFVAHPQTCLMPAFRVPEPSSNRQSNNGLQARIAARGNDGLGITLALGGGFSRGFAHLGVLEVLEQERLPISRIVGTSIGALLGAAYADGISLRDLCDLGRRVRIRDFLRFHPRESSSSEKRKDCIGKFVQTWFRAGSVEELSIPMSIVATDLDTGAPYVFSRGPIEVAIRASCAFPGLVKPVEYEGHLLADGCIVAPVPTDIAARNNDGCVLGINVGNKEDMSDSPKDAVKLFDMKYRASHRSALEPSWSRCADLIIEPKVAHIHWNDFSRVDEAVAAGAEAMRIAIPFVREILARRQQQERSVQSLPFRAGRGLNL
jgi:NTE family protein